jgi:aminoglycoside 3-N-acetyltransferase
MNLLERVSGVAVRYFKPEHLTAAREAYFALRTKLHPLMKLVHGTFDTAALRAHLQERVGTDFEVLMVHSSVNHMKPMYLDNPLDLVRMLIDYCGPDRTLVMPAFYFGDPTIGGAYATFQKNPRFDLRRTPSQMGLATELFRRSKGVMQSRHPVYRVAALGPLAQTLTQGHEIAGSACGAGTPFEFMAKHDTRIIGIGKPIQVLTQAHHVDELLGDEFPVPTSPSTPLSMTLVDGTEEIPLQLRGRGFTWRFNIWKLREIMRPDDLQEWNFHHVPMFAAKAADVTSSLIEAARRGVTLYDPL